MHGRCHCAMQVSSAAYLQHKATCRCFLMRSVFIRVPQPTLHRTCNPKECHRHNKHAELVQCWRLLRNVLRLCMNRQCSLCEMPHVCFASCARFPQCTTTLDQSVHVCMQGARKMAAAALHHRFHDNLARMFCALGSLGAAEALLLPGSPLHCSLYRVPRQTPTCQITPASNTMSCILAMGLDKLMSHPIRQMAATHLKICPQNGCCNPVAVPAAASFGLSHDGLRDSELLCGCWQSRFTRC